MELEKLKNIVLSDEPSILIKENEEYIFSLIPELEKCKGFEQNNDWHIYDVYNHILKVIDNVPKDIRVRLAALFHDVGKPTTYSIDENGIGHFYNHWSKSMEVFLKFAKKHLFDVELARIVANLIYFHDINFDKLKDENISGIIKKFNKQELELLFKLKRADLLAQNPKYHNLLENYDIQEKRLLSKYELIQKADER